MANARLPPERNWMGEAVRLAATREKATLHPGVASYAVAHGEALAHAGRLADAIGEFQRALRIDYESADARFALGSAWLSAGEPEKALEAFAKLDCSLAGVSERVAEARAMLARPRFDASYVRHLFNQFSADYDARMLGQLSYRGPQILRELADLVMPGRADLAVLDLGCGTGLSGAVFADLASCLDGVDLSPQMIEKARSRNIYDSLAVADIETLLADAGRDYDLILAADTLIYLGDLEAVFASVARRLRSDGFFLFTVERKEAEGFELGPKRRWWHSEAYLRDLAARTDFDVAGLVSCTPRSEANVPVDGLAVALSRNAEQRFAPSGVVPAT